MRRLIILICYAILMSCQDRIICPAFQSTYILDDSTRNAYFSYVWQLDENTRTQFLAQQKGQNPEDSLGVVAQPKTDYYAYAGEKVVPWRLQKRTKYGIIKKVPYPIKNYRLRTAPMENVLAPEPITNDFVASDFGDSLAIDSLSIAMDSISLDSLQANTIASIDDAEADEIKYLYGYDPSDNFNVEQEYYNKYFGEQLIDKRPKPEPVPVDSLGAAAVADSITTKEPFFKGLFKKKKKKEPEEVDEPPTEGEPTEESPETTSEEKEGNGNGGL